MGSELQFTDGAIRAIAKMGLERGGGARGLRGILEEVLLDSMFDVPDSVSLSAFPAASSRGVGGSS